MSARKTGIVAARASGETVTLTAKQAKAFGVFERQDIEVSAGDRILLQANRREKGFRATNGELVTVASVEAGAIQLEDGRALPADYRQFTHGYAVTAHRSQGGKADFTIVMGDRMARDTFYVAVTRGQEGLAIVTSDSQGLQESIGVSADRQSAIELARQAAPAADRRKPDDFHAYEARHPEVKQRVHHQQKSELKEGEKEEYAHTHAVGVGI